MMKPGPGRRRILAEERRFTENFEYADTRRAWKSLDLTRPLDGAG